VDRPGDLSAQEGQFLEAFLEELNLCYRRTLTTLQGRDHQSQQMILQTTQQQQSALMASLTHDLQTPLASILGSLETLKNANLNLNRQQNVELAEIAYVQSHRLLDLTKNLLQLSKIEANAISLSGQPIYLNEIIETMLSRLDVQHQQRIDLHCHHPVKACWGDPTLVMQALFNPLDNALKSSPGKVTVDIFPGSEQDSSACQI
jgi:two-component system sensor histidine kinase KdpD